jgi:hypothetical protein
MRMRCGGVPYSYIQTYTSRRTLPRPIADTTGSPAAAQFGRATVRACTAASCLDAANIIKLAARWNKVIVGFLGAPPSLDVGMELRHCSSKGFADTNGIRSDLPHQ